MERDEYKLMPSYRKFIEHLEAQWSRFLNVRDDRLRHGNEAEKVAEAITEDLLTGPMDWNKGDILYQVNHADIVLSENGIKHLLIEVKRPGTFSTQRQSFEQALRQAHRYADEQHVKRIAVTDGCYFYAADVEHGGLKDRLFVGLNALTVPSALWWISVHGIYKPCADVDLSCLSTARDVGVAGDTEPTGSAAELLSTRHKLPAKCYAYVGDATKTATWKLPYRTIEGAIDQRRLPMAIRAVITNFHGNKVKGIPEQAIPEVLERLAVAAVETGKLSPDGRHAGSIYYELAGALEQLGIKLKIAG